ncbi:MAG: DUF262 domain-containing protein, partial [Lysobacter sp.]
MESTTVDFGFSGIASQLKSRLLAVPVYQRAYSWKLEQVDEYASDLRTAFGQKQREYFLGTVVLTKSGAGDRDTIIDGQQRLATTAIFLACIQETYLQKMDETRANIISTEYLIKTDLKSATVVPRLKLSNEDDFFFSEFIIKKNPALIPSKPSHELIKNAYVKLLEITTSI